jgi:hypothetical protein
MSRAKKTPLPYSFPLLRSLHVLFNYLGPVRDASSILSIDIYYVDVLGLPNYNVPSISLSFLLARVCISIPLSPLIYLVRVQCFIVSFLCEHGPGGGTMCLTRGIQGIVIRYVTLLIMNLAHTTLIIRKTSDTIQLCRLLVFYLFVYVPSSYLIVNHARANFFFWQLPSLFELVNTASFLSFFLGCAFMLGQSLIVGGRVRW